jgi:hypothetical protein
VLGPTPLDQTEKGCKELRRRKYVERRLTETNLIVAPDVAVLVPGLVPGVLEAGPLLQDGVVERVRLAAAPLTSLQTNQ